jgi:hypothetical protein
MTDLAGFKCFSLMPRYLRLSLLFVNRTIAFFAMDFFADYAKVK